MGIASYLDERDQRAAAAAKPVSPKPSTVTQAPPPPPAKDVPANVPGGQTKAAQPPAQPQPGGFLPQSVTDFTTVAGQQFPIQEAWARATGQPVDLVTLHAQAEAARQRLGPFAAGAADITGAIANPTFALNAVPYVGPGLQGAAQEAIKSYGQGASWSDIAKNAAYGFGAGEASLGAANVLRPEIRRYIASGLTDLGSRAALGYLTGAHTGSEIAGLGAALGSGYITKPLADFAGDFAAKWGEWGGARKALQNLILGSATGLPQGVPDYNNLIPGQ